MLGRGLKAAAAAILLLVAGCATPGPILNENVGALRTGIGAASQQSQIAFDAANKLAREQSVNAKVADPSRSLDPDDFPLPAPPEGTAKWAQAFKILDSYGAALQSLVDPKRSQAGGDALQELGTTLNGSTLAAGIPASLNAAFSTFGSALLQARSERKATAVMRQTDGAFNAVVGDMAKAIGTGGSDVGSLQNSVFSSWENSVLTKIEDDYAALQPTDQANRRATIQRYLDAMNARDKQLADLSQLRQSLLALGEAHSAAARGEPGDALFWVKRVNDWLDEMKARTKAIEAKEKESQQ